MKTLIVAITVTTLSICTIFAQSSKKTTFLNVISKVAQAENLEISYNPDNVPLDDSTCFEFSQFTDSCYSEIEKLLNVTISKNKTHIIIKSSESEKIRISGIVIDSVTQKPLPYAHLLIKNSGSGTISNIIGRFSFQIANKNKGFNLEFSFIGYESQTITIPAENTENLIIKLKPRPYALADIYVLPNGNEAVDIVKRAVKNIKRNYDRNTHQIEAFYRNTNYRDTTATQLIEAALLIEDKGIMHQATTTKIELKEVRKSTNYQIPMDKKHKAAIKIMEEYFGGHRNIFYRSYSNYVRTYRDDWWYKPLTQYTTFKYEFEGCEWMDSVKVYKIRFTYDQLWPDGRRASENKNIDNGGFIYINSEDWAILKIEHWWKAISKNHLQNLAIKDNYISKNEIGYQKINGKYYLKYKSGFFPPNGKNFVYENPDAPEKEKIIKERQYAEMTLLVTRVVTDKKEMDKIRYREKLAKNENSYETKYPYNPRFWNNYNILKENPVEEQFVKEMEWEKSLDIQFKENSSNHAEVE